MPWFACAAWAPACRSYLASQFHNAVVSTSDFENLLGEARMSIIDVIDLSTWDKCDETHRGVVVERDCIHPRDQWVKADISSSFGALVVVPAPGLN
jgi:hypothetical protein